MRRQLYGHLPPIMKTIQVRRARHAGHCWRSKDELVSDRLLWTPTYGQAKAGQPARTYIQQLCEDTGCNTEDLPEVMNDMEKWREMVKDIRAGGMTWWWWYLVRFWWKDCIVLESPRFPLVCCFWRGPLSCFTDSILDKFVKTCHSLWCVWLWRVFCTLSRGGGFFFFLGGVSE